MTDPAGAPITLDSRGRLVVPDHPIVPFIEGDGTGPDIWRASVRVLDAAVKKAYGGKRQIDWKEVYAGEKANKLLNTWLHDETVAACREYLVSIKGPLTTPIGGGIRSLNVALRQMLDLFQTVSCKICTRDLPPADTDLMHRPSPHIRGCTLQAVGLEAKPLRVSRCCSIPQFIEKAVCIGEELLRKTEDEFSPAQPLQFKEKRFVYDGRIRTR